MSATDFHNHLMPGVDDGAGTEDDSRAALAAFLREGVTHVVTTPHFNVSDTHRPEVLEARLAELDEGWERLTAVVAEFPEMHVWRGAECMLDLPDPIFGDERLQLAGSPFVLVEFPYLTVPPRSVEVIVEVARQGVVPVLAHPERYQGLPEDLELAGEWRRAGAHLQVNGPSLLGKYGPQVRRNAWELLGRGWAEYLCSDYHARGNPRVAEYRAAVEEAGGDEIAQLLCEINPGRLLDGQMPIPVAPLPAGQTLWTRLTAALGLGSGHRGRG